jgi:hypothetical protein
MGQAGFNLFQSFMEGTNASRSSSPDKTPADE